MTQPSAYLGEATEIATKIVRDLTGRRWVWPAITTTEFVDLDPWPNVIILQGRPVISVESVVRTMDDGTVVPQEYVLENKHRIRLTDYRQFAFSSVLVGDTAYTGAQYVTQNSLVFPDQTPQLYAAVPPRKMAVTYTYGSPPPAQLGRAIEVLAQELVLQMEGSDECRLPDNVTSVNRQGLSMQLTSPDDFLAKGETGISEVDQAIRNFNVGRAKRPARVYSPSSPPARRTGTTQAP